MKSSGTTLNLSPVEVDAAHERVLLRCYTCRRIRQELNREQLYHLLTRSHHADCRFRCYTCDRTTVFPQEAIVMWLRQIDEFRDRTIRHWNDPLYYDKLRADFRLNYYKPNSFYTSITT